METDRLIRALAEDLRPVRPLERPWRRTIAWAALAFVYLAALVLVNAPREDLGARMREPLFLLEQAAALLTGLAAASAAFATVVPGYGRGAVLWPLAPLSVWIGTVGIVALREYGQGGAGVLAVQADWACVGTIILGASLPAVVMGGMLRRGAPLTPRVTAALGALAAAGLGNLGICLFHPHSSSLVLLVWHCGTVLALAALAGAAGARVLRWPPSRRVSVSAS
jgi:hypothetical protein